jgi:hypothetical protein
MANPAESEVQNLLPVQAYFDAQGNFQTFIGQGRPFYATANPQQSGLNITSSTINSTTIGAITPSTGVFTNIATTTGTISTAPSAPTDIANKQYVDFYAAGLSWKAPVLTATSANITLSGLQTINGVTVVAGDRVLVKDQSTASQNGIYIASASAWTYAVGADDWAEYVGAIVFVASGSLNGTAWYSTAQPGGTLGTTALNWSNFSVASSYTAGTGLTLIGTQFSITNTGVSAATYGSASSVPVFAVNAQGQLTSVTNTNIAINGNQITSGTIDSGRLSGSYSGITGLGTLGDLTVTNAIVGSITGNAATATTAGSATTATTATTATNLAGGASGNVPYQTSSGTTTFLATGSNGQVLTLASGVPSWATPTTGTVTSVGGTGTVSGISLSGTVTSSGNLTLGGTLDLSSPPAIGGTSPNTAKFTTALIGSGANFTDYPNAQLVSTQSKISGYGHTYRIGLVGEAQANSSDADIWGVGVYGKAWTNGGTRCAGIEGDAGVTNTADTGTATAVRAYSNSTHAGGLNVGMTVSASGSSVGNYALYMQNGDLFSAAAQSWELVDNSNSALRINTSGKTGILDIITTNGAEGIATSGNLNVVGTIALNGSTGTSGYVLTSNGASAPTWQANASGLAITDDTTTNATRYLAFTSATSGSITGADVSSTKLQYNPSTGVLTSTGFSGAGAFTTLSASSTVSGTGFSTYLASPPAIGGSTAGAGTFTNLTATTSFTSSETATFSKAVRVTITTDNDLSFDMNAASNFKCTPTGGGALTFTNITSGQTGNIILVNGSNYAITAAATTKVSATCLATISATGTYWLSFYTDGTNVYVANTGALA